METGKHTLVALLENRPGVLNRAVSLFRRRAFNLDSLTVGHTDCEDVSRMTAVVEGTKAEAERLARELDRLVSVIRVEAMTARPAVSRDLALIKVAVDAETRPEVMHICEVFRARIVDVARKSVIVELTGTESKIEGFADLLRPLGIIEMVRTGLVSMARAEHVLEHDSNVSSWVDHRRRLQADRLLKEAV